MSLTIECYIYIEHNYKKMISMYGDDEINLNIFNNVLQFIN